MEDRTKVCSLTEIKKVLFKKRFFKSEETKTENGEAIQIKDENTQKNNENSKLREFSNFDFSLWNRKFHDVDYLPDTGSPFTKNYSRFYEKDKAFLWHVRFGHASIAYLKILQLKHSENKKLNTAVFDESLLDCEVCLISKFNKLAFSGTRNNTT